MQPMQFEEILATFAPQFPPGHFRLVSPAFEDQNGCWHYVGRSADSEIDLMFYGTGAQSGAASFTIRPIRRRG